MPRPRSVPWSLPRSFAASAAAHLVVLGAGVLLGLLDAVPERSVTQYATTFAPPSAPEFVAEPAEILEPVLAPESEPEPELAQSEVWSRPEPFEPDPTEPGLSALDPFAPRPVDIGELRPPAEEPEAAPLTESVRPSPEAPVALFLPPSPLAPSNRATKRVEEPAPLHAPPPDYPPLALRAGEQGSVLCRLFLDERGRVERVAVVESSGSSRLDRAACKALSSWLFEPRREDGRPVPSIVQHRVTFRLSAS